MFAYCLNNPVKNIDGTGKYTYTTYTYTCEIENGYGPIYITGTIYIYQGDDIKDIEFFYDPDNRPEGYVDGRDVIVLDKRKTDARDMIMYKSYWIMDYPQQDAIITKLLEYEENDPSQWGRTRKSLHTEWFWHNVFADFDKSAKDTNFDYYEEGKSGWYFIRKALEKA